MKRVLIVAASILLLGIIGIGVYLYNNIDPIVKAAIEKNGSAILGTEVSVGSVDISLKTGSGTIRDVKVKNPQGFEGDAFTLGEITLDIQVASLNKDPIVIDEINIAAPNARVVLNKQGRSNIDVIMESVDRYQASSPGKPGNKQDSGFEKRFRIDQFTFAQGRVAADATALGRGKMDVELPPLTLSDVGGPSGDTPDGIGKTVTRAFLDAVMKAFAGELTNRAVEKGEDSARKALEKLLN